MSNFLVDRNLVCKRLSMSRRASYRIFPPTHSAMLETMSVVSLLNGCAINVGRVEGIPFDIVTAERLADELGITKSRVTAWTRRMRDPIPHWRINKQTTRYPLAAARKWAGEG